jgi:steroid delta-isomerase-like uncharacterized protein
MSTDQVKDVARSYFEELTNKQNLDFADQLFTHSVAFYDPAIIPDGAAHGLSEVKRFFSVFFHAFPDLHFAVDDFFAEGNRVAIRFTWTGTHRAKLLGITLSERHVSVPGIDIFHIADGKIAEVRVAFDRAQLVKQLGLVSRHL